MTQASRLCVLPASRRFGQRRRSRRSPVVPAGSVATEKRCLLPNEASPRPARSGVPPERVSIPSQYFHSRLGSVLEFRVYAVAAQVSQHVEFPQRHQETKCSHNLPDVSCHGAPHQCLRSPWRLCKHKPPLLGHEQPRRVPEGRRILARRSSHLHLPVCTSPHPAQSAGRTQ